jgi:acyl transferase domain-containing protein/3-hydroxymyristoyl/3-hydroxydecanoyl-(acyl carrier protein) dehydratase
MTLSHEPRIAIVGIGGLFPGASDLRQFWANVAAAVDLSRDVPPGRWPVHPADVVAAGAAVPDKVATSRGYYLDEIPTDCSGLNVDRATLAKLDPVFHLILQAGKQAFSDCVTAPIDRRRVGVILGHIALPTSTLCTLAEEYLGRLFVGELGWKQEQPWTNPLNRYVAGLPAGILAGALRLGGGNCTLDAACASSLYAVKLAAEELRAGRADLMLTGGAARPDCLYTQMGFSQLRALSPTGRCSPFDAAGDGLVVGEGCGILALKRLDDALRDGDHIYALLAAAGLSNDVEGNLLAPASEGQLRAMRDAYQEAGWKPSDVDLIECHATGTPVGDAVEFASLNSLWTNEPWRPGQCVIGSVKSSVGHLLTGAGAAGLVKLLLALQHEILPPTANFRTPQPKIDLSRSPFRVLTRAERWPRRNDNQPRRAAISGFGFGGINAHVLLEEYPPAPRTNYVSASLPESRSSESIAIVGMDARFGPWSDLSAVRHRVLNGADSLVPAPKKLWWGAETSAWFHEIGFHPDSFAGWYIDELEIAADQFRIPPNELREMLPQQLLMLQSAAAALADAGSWEKSRQRAGAFLGLALDLNTTNYRFRMVVAQRASEWLRCQGEAIDESATRQWLQDVCDSAHPSLNANRTMGGLASIAASRIARTFQFAGPSFTICSEESSAGRALELAVRALQRREIDLALTGGIDLAGDLRSVLATHAHRPFSPAARGRPFDCDANGPIPGEGAACFVLKRRSDAERDGDRIYAIVRGVGVASGNSSSDKPPDVGAYTTAMERAFADADIDRSNLGLLIAQGSGSPPEDEREAEALSQFFAHSGGQIPALTSAVADVGHTGAASFAASLAKACLALHHRIIPALQGCQSPRPLVAARFRCLREAMPWQADEAGKPRRAGVSGFSIDGNCIHVVLEEHAASVPEVAEGFHPPRPARLQIRVPVGGRPFAVPPPPRPPSAIQTEQPADRVLAGLVSTREATAAAHAAYLDFAESGAQGITRILALSQSAIPHEIPITAFSRNHSEPMREKPFLDAAGCFEFAAGSIGKALGPEFAPIDLHPTRVRLPDGPLMLVDRILNVDGQPQSLSSGRVVTEHEVHAQRWYLAEGHIPASICIESGQADLFLSAYLGIDFVTKGLAVYRLLDAAVTFHRALPRSGETVRYDIHIDRFFRQGDTHLFRFRFEGNANGEPIVTMTNGCAGFFTAAELAAGRGIVQTELQRRLMTGKRQNDWRALAPMKSVERYDADQLEALRVGDLSRCFGPTFDNLSVVDPLTLPGGMLKLVDRVVEFDTSGGRFRLGRLRAEQDIRSDDWFLTCHFVDDQVMPGTLMYECCLHTLRIFLLRLGWIGSKGTVSFEPVPGVASVLKCRGQVVATTRTAMYEISIKELGYCPEPYAICDALMYADGKPIVEITNLSLRLAGTTRDEVEEMWKRDKPVPPPPPEARSGDYFSIVDQVGEGFGTQVAGAPGSRLGEPEAPVTGDRHVAGRSSPSRAALFTRDQLVEFAIGTPSTAFGEKYRAFDKDRFIARLPGPPFLLMDRIMEARNCEPWKLRDGAEATAEFDVLSDAWYFTANRQPTMPYAVLQEIALQPCGWLAAYLGSVLVSDDDLHFRNLGGTATQLAAASPDAGTLSTHVKLTRVSRSAGMIIEHFDFSVKSPKQKLFEGQTHFGFFSDAALAQQVGIRDTKLFQPDQQQLARARSFPTPCSAPFPANMLRMFDDVELFIADGGSHGLGFIRGCKQVNPDDWFFKAHFHLDPVWPGSLGLESFLLSLKILAHDRWGDPRPGGQTLALGVPHTWTYRGQVIPTHRNVMVEAEVTAAHDVARTLRANGYLSVDGRVIYRMQDFTLQS